MFWQGLSVMPRCGGRGSGLAVFVAAEEAGEHVDEFEQQRVYLGLLVSGVLGAVADDEVVRPGGCLLLVLGINRHGGGDGRALRRRASDPRRPRVMRRRPRGAGEALTGARAGRAIEPRNPDPGCPRSFRCGRQHPWSRYREWPGDPARSEIHGMYGTSMRENRESPCPPVRAGLRAGRSGTPRR